MHLFKLTMIYLTAIIACTFLLMMEVPTITVSILLSIYIFGLIMFPQYNIALWSNNISKIDRFVTKNRTKPTFAYPYAVAHESLEEQKLGLQKMLNKYKQPIVQHNYRSVLAALNKDFEGALAEAKQIPKEPIRSYNIAHTEVFLGNIDAAKALIPKLTKPWMPHAIEGLIAYEQHDLRTFEKESEAAIAKARGIQKHVLFYTFKGRKEHFMVK
ncbi:hypothetical protein JFL43_11475 [Viridibacillus sp. YIM B01967]|uniref:Uncharacterized protein n=1 Tax=Viridibacillus soli TaxID=2798301 RepID=A0ABS1H7T4_9BACL|nr:hypothetical protein [Viridibacillus soli]MBK3495460.1 hypothetical protein [Viridibacillus soli]